MNISNGDQLRICGIAMIAGALLAFIYDLAKGMRPGGKSGERALAVLDVLYWVFAAFAVFALALKLLSGHVRVYYLAALLAGAVIYRTTLGRAARFLIGKIRHLLGRAYRAAERAVRRPIDRVKRAVSYRARLWRRYRRRAPRLWREDRGHRRERQRGRAETGESDAACGGRGARLSRGRRAEEKERRASPAGRSPRRAAGSGEK